MRRRIAEVLVSLHGPQTCTPLAQLTEHPTFRKLDIAEINTLGSNGANARFAAAAAATALPDYQGPERLGQLVNGARNEGICRPT